MTRPVRSRSGRLIKWRRSGDSDSDEHQDDVDEDTLEALEAVAAAYDHVPGAPVDLMQIQEATIQIIETTRFEKLLLNPNLTHFVDSMARIGPYCDPPEAPIAIEAMVECWTQRRSQHAMQQSVRDEKKRVERVKQAEQAKEFLEGTLKLKSGETTNSESYNASHANETGFPNLDPVMIEESTEAGGSAGTSGLSKEEPLPTVDEHQYAYSTWMLHEDPHKRLLAAGRFIKNLPNLGKSLEDDPALVRTARPEALHFLWEGGRDNTYAGKIFLDAFKAQERREAEMRQKETISISGTAAVGSARRPSTSGSPSKKLAEKLEQEFTLSDGEAEYSSEEDDD